MGQIVNTCSVYIPRYGQARICRKSSLNTLVGKGKRSHFIEEAVREKLRRENLISDLEVTAGILSAGGRPEWASGESIAAWVRESRTQDDARLKRLRRG